MEACTISLFWSAIFGPSSVVAMCTSAAAPTNQAATDGAGKKLEEELARMSTDCQAAKNQVLSPHHLGDHLPVAHYCHMTCSMRSLTRSRSSSSAAPPKQATVAEKKSATLASQAKDLKAALAEAQAATVAAKEETEGVRRAQKDAHTATVWATPG